VVISIAINLMKTSKQLTHSTILASKPTSKPYKLSDTDRLYVLVTVSGKKYWKWNYRLDGTDSTYTIGTFPDIKPAEARERRMAAEKIVAQGIHPADFDAEKISQAKTEKATTFWAVAEEWIEANKIKWTPYYLKQIESGMRRYVGDTPLGARPIKAVTTPDMYQLIASVANRTERTGLERKSTGAHAVATNLRLWCNAVFRFAIISGRAERNPVADLKASDVITKPKVKNNLALSPTELQRLLIALAAFTGQRKTGIAMELLMITFVRTGELRCATWNEFDFENALWTVPSERMKIKDVGDHLVPLAPQAIELLRELKTITGTSSKEPRWLFPNERRDTEPMTATTINRALERMKFNGKGTIGFSAHGFRGTASTRLHELGYAPEVIELQLAHQERNAVKAAYNKAKHVTQRTKMMCEWADYINRLRQEASPTHATSDLTNKIAALATS
jgi:integrase